MERIMIFIDGSNMYHSLKNIFGRTDQFFIPVFSFPESPFANYLVVAIQETVDGVKTQIGHAQVVGIGINNGDGQSAAPIFANRAVFSGKLFSGVSFRPSGFFRSIPAHELVYDFQQPCKNRAFIVITLSATFLNC